MKDRKEGRQREVVIALEYTPRHEYSGIVNTQIHGYLTSALNRCEWAVSRLGRLQPELLVPVG